MTVNIGRGLAVGIREYGGNCRDAGVSGGLFQLLEPVSPFLFRQKFCGELVMSYLVSVKPKLIISMQISSKNVQLKDYEYSQTMQGE